MFAERFGWTPSVVRELDLEEYQMLLYAIEEVNKKQEEELNNNSARGGSSTNGQKTKKITSLKDLMNNASDMGCSIKKES